MLSLRQFQWARDDRTKQMHQPSFFRVGTCPACFFRRVASVRWQTDRIRNRAQCVCRCASEKSAISSDQNEDDCCSRHLKLGTQASRQRAIVGLQRAEFLPISERGQSPLRTVGGGVAAARTTAAFSARSQRARGCSVHLCGSPSALLPTQWTRAAATPKGTALTAPSFPRPRANIATRGRDFYLLALTMSALVSP